ncbi:MAG: hypothetical protein EPN85_05850 [Bacteroidetes bacterium]|nr:MAG: hypothetical protein EPN85_05850 [Bacteroidota bacterium]
MQTIKLTIKEYENLKKKASIYDRVLRFSPETLFEIENYSDSRVQELLKQDKVDSSILATVKKLLRKK